MMSDGRSLAQNECSHPALDNPARIAYDSLNEFDG